MKIGASTEIKNQEYRVGLTASLALQLSRRDHTVFSQIRAGMGIGAHDLKSDPVPIKPQTTKTESAYAND